MPRRVALDGLSLDIRAGECTAILGPNGSGKSTFLRIAATLERADEGSIAILGHDADDAPKVRRLIGVVFQSPGLDALLTVLENLRLQCAISGTPARERADRIRRVAASLDLADRLHDRVGRLSGGLRRRADLARALVAEPRLILLDEPTAGLDLEARRAFIDLLRTRAADAGLTVILTTHDMDEASAAHRVIMLSDGRIVADGAPAELRASLGERVVHAHSSMRGVLDAAGLHVRESPPDSVACSGSAEAIEHACRELVRRGAAFHVGPPSLADVFLHRTGVVFRAERAEPTPDRSE